MHGLDTGMQSVTMQHISSKDIPVEGFHLPCVCVLPPKAVSSFSSVFSSSSLWLTYSKVFDSQLLGGRLW